MRGPADSEKWKIKADAYDSRIETMQDIDRAEDTDAGGGG
jgi:hypothetical protein